MADDRLQRSAKRCDLQQFKGPHPLHDPPHDLDSIELWRIGWKKMNDQALVFPNWQQRQGGFGLMNGAVVQPKMRRACRVALGRQGLAPRPEIHAAHLAFLEADAYRIEVEIAAPDRIEPLARPRVHLMGMRSPCWRPRIGGRRVLRKASLVSKPQLAKALGLQGELAGYGPPRLREGGLIPFFSGYSGCVGKSGPPPSTTVPIS